MDIYGESIYINVSNNDSVQYFPHNNPSNFRVKLEKRLELKGCWKICLCEISISNVIVNQLNGVDDIEKTVVNNVQQTKSIHIHCNVCTGLIVNGEQTRILRTLPIKKNQ